MSLQAQINADFIQAYKDGDTLKKSVLSLLKSSIANSEKEAKRPPTDAEIEVLIQKEIKKRDESATAFSDAGQAARAWSEIAEGNFLKEYLPEQLDDTELDIYVQSAITLKGSNLGQVIKWVKEEVGTRADGRRVSEAVKKALS